MTKPVIEELGLAPIENLVFEGGGVKGIVYLGALKALYAQGLMDHVKRVGGSSAGGITAMLIGLGYQLEEIQEIMQTMDFTKFQDAGETFWQKIPKDLDFLNLRENAVKKVEEVLKVALSNKHGIYSGDVFLEWARAKIAEKLGNPDATFADLREAMKIDPSLKDMMFTATNISGNGPPLQYFSADHTPNVRIADAVRATMSFPGAFEAYPIEINGILSIFVDGGVLSNCPIEYFDDPRFLPENSPAGINPRSLAMRVDDPDEIGNYKWRLRGGEASETSTLMGYGRGLGGAALSDRSKVYHRGFNTVQISDCGVATLNFNLSEVDKKNLQDSGEKAVTEHVQLYLRGAISNVQYYKDKFSFYRSKIAKGEEGIKEVLDKKQALLEELNRIVKKPAQASDSALRSKQDVEMDMQDQIRFNEILWEYDIVNRSLVGIEKSKEQSLMESIEKMLETQNRLAEKNHEELTQFHQYSTNLLDKIKKLNSEYIEDIAAFETLMDLERGGGKNLLQKIFAEITKLHQELNQMKLEIVKISNLDKYDAIKVMELQHRLLTRQMEGAKTIQSNLSRGLNTNEIRSSIGDMNIKKVEQLILSEVTTLGTEKADTYQPPSLIEFHRNLTEAKKETEDRIQKISLALHQQEEQLKQNAQRLQRLNFNRKACGKNLDKMLDLSNKLTDFIASQNSLGTGMCKLARGFAKGLGFLTLAYPAYLLVRAGIKFAKQDTYKKLKKFERRFYTNQEIYLKHAKKLKDKIKTLSQDWASDKSKAYNPNVNVENFLTMLRDTQKQAREGHYEKGLQKETKTKFDSMLNDAIHDMESSPKKK